MINEIIATIIAGLPQTALALLLISTALLYGFVLDRALDSNHNILIGVVLAFGVFLCCMGLSYFFGSII